MGFMRRWSMLSSSNEDKTDPTSDMYTNPGTPHTPNTPSIPCPSPRGEQETLAWLNSDRPRQSTEAVLRARDRASLDISMGNHSSPRPQRLTDPLASPSVNTGPHYTSWQDLPPVTERSADSRRGRSLTHQNSSLSSRGASTSVPPSPTNPRSFYNAQPRPQARSVPNSPNFSRPRPQQQQSPNQPRNFSRPSPPPKRSGSLTVDDLENLTVEEILAHCTSAHESADNVAASEIFPRYIPSPGYASPGFDRFGDSSDEEDGYEDAEEETENHYGDWAEGVRAILPAVSPGSPALPSPAPPSPIARFEDFVKPTVLEPTIMEPEEPEELEELEEPPYNPFSAHGREHFLTICAGLNMPPDTTFREVESYLSDNLTIIRCLALGTIPHPDRLYYHHSTLSEVRPGTNQSRKDNEALWEAITEIAWQDVMLSKTIEMTYSTNRETTFCINRGLVKVREGNTPRDFHFRMLAEEEDYEREKKDEFEAIMRKRQQRPGSLLSHVATPDDDDE